MLIYIYFFILYLFIYSISNSISLAKIFFISQEYILELKQKKVNEEISILKVVFDLKIFFLHLDYYFLSKGPSSVTMDRFHFHNNLIINKNIFFFIYQFLNLNFYINQSWNLFQTRNQNTFVVLYYIFFFLNPLCLYLNLL